MFKTIVLFICLIKLLFAYPQIKSCKDDETDGGDYRTTIEWQTAPDTTKLYQFSTSGRHSIAIAKRSGSTTEVKRYQWSPITGAAGGGGVFTLATDRSRSFECEVITGIVNDAVEDDSVIAIRIQRDMVKGHTIPTIRVDREGKVTFKFKDLDGIPQTVIFNGESTTNIVDIGDETTYRFKKVGDRINWECTRSSSESESGSIITTAELRQSILNNLGMVSPKDGFLVRIKIGKYRLQPMRVSIITESHVAKINFVTPANLHKTVEFAQYDKKSVQIGSISYTWNQGWSLPGPADEQKHWAPSDGSDMISNVELLQQIKDALSGDVQIEIGGIPLNTLSKAPVRTAPRRERTHLVSKIVENCKPFGRSTLVELDNTCLTPCKKLISETQKWGEMGPQYCKHFGREFVEFKSCPTGTAGEVQKKALCKTKRISVERASDIERPCITDGGDDTKHCKTKCHSITSETGRRYYSENPCKNEFDREEHYRGVCEQFQDSTDDRFTHPIGYYWECNPNSFCTTNERLYQCSDDVSKRLDTCRQDLTATDKGKVKCNNFQYGTVNRISMEGEKTCAIWPWTSTKFATQDSYFIVCTIPPGTQRKLKRRKKKKKAKAREEYESLLSEFYYDEEIEIAREKKAERLLNIEWRKLAKLANRN